MIAIQRQWYIRLHLHLLNRDSRILFCSLRLRSVMPIILMPPVQRKCPIPQSDMIIISSKIMAKIQNRSSAIASPFSERLCQYIHQPVRYTSSCTLFRFRSRCAFWVKEASYESRLFGPSATIQAWTLHSETDLRRCRASTPLVQLCSRNWTQLGWHQYQELSFVPQHVWSRYGWVNRADSICPCLQHTSNTTSFAHSYPCLVQGHTLSWQWEGGWGASIKWLMGNGPVLRHCQLCEQQAANSESSTIWRASI
jgi:hypothetical protein